MDLILIRKQYRSDGIFSVLQDEEGQQIAITLEHAYMERDGWTPKLPDGEYLCVRGIHRLAGMKHNFLTFEISHVPCHTDILFHMGNYNGNSQGCVLLGEEIVQSASIQWIKNSLRAFRKFMALQDEDQFILTVK